MSTVATGMASVNWTLAPVQSRSRTGDPRSMCASCDRHKRSSRSNGEPARCDVKGSALTRIGVQAGPSGPGPQGQLAAVYMPDRYLSLSVAGGGFFVLLRDPSPRGWSLCASVWRSVADRTWLESCSEQDGGQPWPVERIS